MMQDKEKLREQAIDNFYKESHEPLGENIRSSDEYSAYIEKLNTLDEKLKILDDDTSDFEINTLAIIEEADRINEKKKARIELVLFVAIASAVLSIYAAMGLIFGFQVILISQIVIVTLIPWIILPVIVMRSRRKSSNG